MRLTIETEKLVLTSESKKIAKRQYRLRLCKNMYKAITLRMYEDNIGMMRKVFQKAEKELRKKGYKGRFIYSDRSLTRGGKKSKVLCIEYNDFSKKYEDIIDDFYEEISKVFVIDRDNVNISKPVQEHHYIYEDGLYDKYNRLGRH